MATHVRRSAAAVLIIACLAVATPAAAADWRIGLGFATASGFDEIRDLHEDNLNAQGFVAESVDGLPVGLFINPYLEFDNGLGVGIGLGPAMLIFGDTEFVDVPVSIDLRYSLRVGDSGFVPYLRAGVMKQLASGDFVDGDKSGTLTAIGLEWRRAGGVDFGIELATSDSEIEFERVRTAGTESIEPFETRVSVFIVF